jgi:hypothetical protein
MSCRTHRLPCHTESETEQIHVHLAFGQRFTMPALTIITCDTQKAQLLVDWAGKHFKSVWERNSQILGMRALQPVAGRVEMAGKWVFLPRTPGNKMRATLGSSLMKCIRCVHCNVQWTRIYLLSYNWFKKPTKHLVDYFISKPTEVPITILVIGADYLITSFS